MKTAKVPEVGSWLVFSIELVEAERPILEKRLTPYIRKLIARNFTVAYNKCGR